MSKNKSRNFSIYLLKEDYDSTNALKEEHGLEEITQESLNLPDGAVLYLSDSPANDPWWKSYWGITRSLKQVLKGAIIFLPVKGRNFAITFGHTYHKLEDTSYEYDFGIRTSLNALDPEKLKSTDAFQPESAKRERVQSPRATNLTFFDFNQDETIIKRLSGNVKEEYKDILTNISGANSLKITSKVSANEIIEICEKLLEIYKKDDYKETFPDLQNITPVKDPILIDKLNEKLLNSFNSKETESLFLTIPDIIDFERSVSFKFSGNGKVNNYDDVSIEEYYNYLGIGEINDVVVANLKSHKLNVTDENGNIIQSYSIYKSLLFDSEIDGKHFHLCEGEWYQVENDYLEKIRNELDPYFKENKYLVNCDKKYENDYNQKIAEENEHILCLDKKNIAPRGERQVEPCDLLYLENETVFLVHVKISTRSASLSHLFNQGLNSVELIRLVPRAKSKLKELSPATYHEMIDEDKFHIIYGVITKKDKNNKSDNLPIFSRISLHRTINSFLLMGISVYVTLITDKVDRSIKK